MTTEKDTNEKKLNMNKTTTSKKKSKKTVFSLEFPRNIREQNRKKHVFVEKKKLSFIVLVLLLLLVLLNRPT